MWDDVERQERKTWQAEEATWALWEVMRTSIDVGHVVARRLGLPYNDVRAMELLSDSPDGMGTVELSRRLGMRSASAAELVDRLVASGHAARAPHPTDRRRVVIRLTEKGHDDALTVLGPLLSRYDRVAKDMGVDAGAAARFLRAVAAEHRAFAEED